jgi:hypothetical protein
MKVSTNLLNTPLMGLNGFSRDMPSNKKTISLSKPPHKKFQPEAKRGIDFQSLL